ncbi:hypothetical protein QYM36_010975 [Artemia franciscana]|uniref:Aminotransferase class I/classII large domain-containing protein n=1 Tax=Artemia franciscana TaxID=6661 RepID=A0AA88L3Z7_ARTSF|nr:hypothetical protein QYM36_010975 [Artemia franciscana]
MALLSFFRYPNLVKHLKELQKYLHEPPSTTDWEIVVTNGSQDGLCKAMEMLVDHGDYVLLEEPCYAGTLSILHPYKPKWLPLSGDKDGLIPSSLKQALDNYKGKDTGSPIEKGPKILYLNPNGANPTGTSISTPRRYEIYKLAQKYDLLILEDDPYYFLQFGEEKSPSFLSLDTDGRVLRFDSFSKILSSGLRLGFVTGPKELVERINLHMQVSVLHASTLSQVLVSQLFDRWKIDGFLSHSSKVSTFYEKQRDHMAAAAEKHLKGLVEWHMPSGGMFLWMKCLHVEDTKAMIMERALPKDIILLPGQAFMTDPNKASPFMRAAFSLATPEKMDIGFAKLAELIREEIQLQRK